MEGLIPLIIALLIGSFFSSKKKKAPEKGQAKPFTAQETQSGPMGKLKEMYEELQREMQPETREREFQQAPQMSPPTNPVIIKRELLQTEKSVKERRVETQKERSNRRANTSNRVAASQSQITKKDVLPTSGDDLIKGIIFSEIIGPPISKR